MNEKLKEMVREYFKTKSEEEMKKIKMIRLEVNTFKGEKFFFNAEIKQKNGKIRKAKINKRFRGFLLLGALSLLEFLISEDFKNDFEKSQVEEIK